MKSEFAHLSETTSLRGKIETDLFTGDKCDQHGGLMCKIYDSDTDYAFAHPCLGTPFYENPIYIVDFVSRTLEKGHTRFQQRSGEHVIHVCAV